MGLLVRRHLDGHGSRATLAREGRSRSLGTPPRLHGVGRRLSIRAVMDRRWMAPAVIAAAGIAGTTAAAVAGHLPAGDAATLAAYAAGGAAVAVAMSLAVLALLRRRSVVVQAAVAGLAPVLAVAIGVAAASLAMFISEHDLRALFVVLIAAGTVGVLSGLVLGRRVATAGRSLGVMARKLGDDGPGTDLSSTDRVPSELAALAAELGATSARLAEARARATAVEQSRRQLVAWVS